MIRRASIRCRRVAEEGDDEVYGCNATCASWLWQFELNLHLGMLLDTAKGRHYVQLVHYLAEVAGLIPSTSGSPCIGWLSDR